MITKPQPSNATPQRISFAAPQIPRMPFSSPIGEEVLSPTSPTQPSQPLRRQSKGPQPSNGQSNTIPSNGMFSKREPSGGDDRRERERMDKSPLQKLNVVTTFSRSPGSAQGAVNGTGKPDQGLGLRRQELPESMSTTRDLGLSHQPSEKSLKPSASKGRLDDLKRAASKASTLSPSDRAVMIGISVPPEDLANHIISTDATPAEAESLSSGRYGISRRPSVTPSIFVTPAQAKAPWSDELNEVAQQPRRRARAASSVYSQAQHNDMRITDPSTVPPIPPLPPNARTQSPNFYLSNGDQPAPLPLRIVSTSTVFDDDEELDSRGRPGSGESQLRMLTNKVSLDSIATRHRSRGWWDHIVTPFWPRSPMTFKVSSPTIPALPNARQATEVRHDQDRSVSNNVPLETPAREGFKSGHTSWTDMSLDAECEKRALGFDEQPHSGPLVSELPRGLPATDTSISAVGHEGFGAASEYYEACLYDMHSPDPYFECQNHTCLPSQVVPMAAIGGQKSTLAATNEDVMPSGILERQNTEPLQLLAVQQAPKNRFSAAFREAVAPDSRPKPRPVSEVTVIEDLDTTPAVEEAHAAPIVRAPEPVPAAQTVPTETQHQHSRDVEESPPQVPSEPTHQQPPDYLPRKEERPPRRYVAVMPPDHQPSPLEHTVSPMTPTPSSQRLVVRDTIPTGERSREDVESQPDGTKHTRNRYYENPETYRPETTFADLYPRPKDADRSQKAWEIREKETRTPRTQTSKVLAGFDKCFGREKKSMSKKKKWMLIALAIGLLLMVILIMVLAMTLTRKSGPGRMVPVQTAWLNMTGYPPIPTGISTIVQPKPVSKVSDCIIPSTMWSCELPKEEQQSLSTGAADQPNFRVEIVFQNGTNGATGNASSINRRSYGGNYKRRYEYIVNPVSAGNFIRNRLLQVRNANSENVFSPSPSPPSQEDQAFLGNTTDDNIQPFDGEYTPFFMSFMSPTKLPSSLLKRQTSSSTGNTTSPFPDLTKSIPPPDTNPNGTAAAAVLLPYPSAQPLRLYNRGQSTEHYGFYTYFSKSIFLKTTAPIDNSSNDTSSILDDEDGGAEENAASVRCTWAQTRFLVQIWTKNGFVASSQALAVNSTVSDNATNPTASSANDFDAPGSFPYPVTIKLDRHGGDINSKQVYCYGIDDEERALLSQKKIQNEIRSVGGQLVNPALGPFGNVNVTLADGGPGGIDGGSGGCGCEWETLG